MIRALRNAVPVLLAALVLSPASYAQDCMAAPEAIVRLRDYTMGNYSVWNTVYGAHGMEQFQGLAMLSNGNVIAGGISFSRHRPEEKRALLVEINRRGKVVWENRHENGPSMSIDAVLADEKTRNIVTLGTIDAPGKGRGVRLGLYDENGAQKQEKFILDPRLDLTYHDMVPAIEGDGGMVLALEAHDRKNPADEFGIVMKISAKGNEVWRRSYRPGIANAFFGIGVVNDSVGMPFYLAGGNMDSEDRRRSGLLMKLEPGGTLVWARQYPRGAAATFRSISYIGDGHFAVAGDIEPYGDLYERSAWIIRGETASGDIVWQRYISLPEYRLFGRDVLGYADGRMAVLLDGVLPDSPEDRDEEEQEEGEEKKEKAVTGEDDIRRNQARLLTLSPRGIVMRDEPFTEGLGGRAQGMVVNARQQRMIVGHAERSHKADDVRNAANYDTDDGWILIASALEAYTDPCIPRRVLVE